MPRIIELGGLPDCRHVERGDPDLVLYWAAISSGWTDHLASPQPFRPEIEAITAFFGLEHVRVERGVTV